MSPIKCFKAFMQVLFKEHNRAPQKEAILTDEKEIPSFITEC